VTRDEPEPCAECGVIPDLEMTDGKRTLCRPCFLALKARARDLVRPSPLAENMQAEPDGELGTMGPMKARQYMRIVPAQLERFETAGWHLVAASRFAADSISLLVMREVPADAVEDYAPTLCAMASARRDERRECVRLLERNHPEAAELLRAEWRRHWRREAAP